MPKAKYEQIYHILKDKIESGEYPAQALLPGEHTLIAELDCSRGTLRRAVSELVREGYVQTMQGKGVRNIFEPARQATFTLGTIETFAESAARNHWTGRSEVLLFDELEADEALAARTGFAPGTPLYYVRRLHYLNDRPLIMNHSYFRQDVACGADARNRGGVDLPLSGERAAHCDHQQQAGGDGGKDHPARSAVSGHGRLQLPGGRQ